MSWALLTGATPASEREQIHAQLESGELDVLFGTHAVLSDNVAFNHLSLVSSTSSTGLALANATPYARRARCRTCSL